MSTGRFNLISIGAIYLTKTGLSSGVPCKTQVSGLDALKLSVTGRVFVAIDGTLYTQTASGFGFPVGISSEAMQQSVFDQIVTAINTAAINGTSITVKVLGDTGDFYLLTVPALPEAVKFSGDFQNESIKDVTFNFIVSGLSNAMRVNPGTYAITSPGATLTYSGA